jgi:phosphate starvation-inducible protein PhoH and related proteins
MYCLILMTFFTFISVRAFSGSSFKVTTFTAMLNPVASLTTKFSASSLSRSTLSMRVKKSKGESIRAIAPHYVPKTGNQEMYVKYLEDERAKIVLGVGPAGSGKTLFACAAAISALRSGMIQKIVMTRPVVPVEEDIGFLPGSMLNKMDPWTRPIFDILGEFYAQKDIDSMLHSGTIDIVPLAYMRGRTFKRSFIIADEMQNSSPNQMLMIATRIGDESKMVITGDLKQSDRGFNNGLADLLGRLKKSGGADESIRFVELESADVQRSPIVRRILDIYSNDEGPRVAAVVKPAVDKSSVDKSSVDKSLEKPAVDKPAEKPTCAIVQKYRKPSNDDAAMMPLAHISKNMDKLL